MNTNIKLALLAVSASFLAGCANLGQSEFTCNSLKKDGVCAGPKDIYELTNHRDSLENLSLEELDNQLHKNHEHSNTNGHTNVAKESSNDDVTVYESRTVEQHSPHNYQKAEVIPQTRFETSKQDGFGAWPNNGEPMAPEALAVMSEPEPMRILINAYTTENGALTMPGYVFVETNPRTFQVGRDATLRPSRIVPLQMKRNADKSLERQRNRAKGVDGLGVQAPVAGEQ